MRKTTIGVFHLHSYNRKLMCNLLASLTSHSFIPLSRWDAKELKGAKGMVILEPELLVTTTSVSTLINQIDSIQIPVLIVSYTTLKLKSKRHDVVKSTNNPEVNEVVEWINQLTLIKNETM